MKRAISVPGASSLRIIAASILEAVAIVLCADLVWILVVYFVKHDSFDIGPLVLLALYPLPIAVAEVRKHNALLDIMIFNLWLGWTVIGWVVALIWACDWDAKAFYE